MVRVPVVSAIALCMALTHTSGAQHSSEVSEAIHEYLESVEKDGFRGVVLVERSGSILLHEGYGTADCSGLVSMPANAVFDIGSITKAVTAAAILRLVADGSLGLSDSLASYLDAPSDKRKITIEQLLRHTSGFPDFLGRDEDYVSREWLIERAFHTELLFEPGRDFSYSNVGYSLLGAIIEELTGTSYEQYVRSKLFDPVAASPIGYVAPDWSQHVLACGEFKTERYGSVLDYYGANGPSWNLMSNGGMMSTAVALNTWFSGLIEGALLPVGETQLLVGALTRTLDSGERAIVISGSNLVFSALYMRILDDTETTLILFTANSEWPKERVEQRILHLLVDTNG